MTGAILFEQQHRGDVWRLEVVTFNGRTFANWRKWWREGETLKPSREGVTFPLDRIGELHAATGAWLASNAPSGPQNGS